MRGENVRLGVGLQRGASSQRDWQQSPDRVDRSVSGTRPAVWSKDGIHQAGDSYIIPYATIGSSTISVPTHLAQN